MSLELEKAIANAKQEIKDNKRQGLRMTNWAINKNIQMVTENPTKHEVDFIKIYSK